ncbi:MAG TPA: DUF87 domain-containing protein, partial [Aggregatilineales bacterium]|nr:DUF87 domain-containing protein [Aggregatilineales bacterium]
MPFIEAPTTFYLGKRYDQTTNKLLDEVVYYDSRDLTTHAVVVGMTGSGKTGMCISLLEEAVLDNIPALIIDPKGDITNLLLTFPELRPQDFAPWVNESDAQRARMDVGEFAADVAKTWKDGLASWGIGSGRIAALKNAAQFSIYTPGSDAGLPVSILASLQAPRDGWEGNDEFHREQISGLVRALLGLVGKNVNPVKDKEHVLISNIFEHAWRNGRDLTLEDIIMQVQNPPFDRLGVFDVNTFFKEKDRFKLAQELNNIIASPSFQTWITGEPLDMRRLLYTAEGKARVSIFYLAHLNDAERAFIITLLTENVLAWMRTLSGTTSLRSIVYFDEVFGHIPPAPRNPPTKDPLLRLLKQGRAFGIGLILATQNPGDLDYKSLSNAGSWFIGKLQTENDKKRVLSGLEAVSTAGNTLNLQEMDKLLSNLSPRVFLLHNVHNGEGSLLVQSRWAMSYLRGPLTRQQIRTLMADQRRMLGLDTAQITPPQDGYQYQPSGSVGQSAALPPQQPLSGTPFFAAAANPSPSMSGGGSRVGTLAPSDVPPPPAELPEDNAHSAPAVGGGGSVPPTNAAPTGNFLDRLAAESKPSAAPKKNFLDRLNEEAPASLPPTAPPTVPPTTPAPTGNTGATPFWLEPTNTPTPRPAGEIGSATQPMGAVSMPPNMPPPANTPPSPAASEATLPNGFFNSPPVLPSSIAQYFLPVTISVQEAVRRTGNMGRYEGSILLYQPVLLAQMGI